MGQLDKTTAEMNAHLAQDFVEEESATAYSVVGADGTTKSFNVDTSTTNDLYEVLGNLIADLAAKKVI